MKVIKLGGGILRTPEDVKNTERVLKLYENQKLAVVVSAFHSVTNMFEELLIFYYQKQNIDIEHFNRIKAYHIPFVEQLFTENQREVFEQVNSIFTITEENLKKNLSGQYLKDYDMIVSTGEFLSSLILFEYLKSKGFRCALKDVRDIVKTDSAFTEAKVNWEETTKNIKSIFDQSDQDFIITQGFIGSDSERNTTTLGREGSDFTAAIMAYGADAEEVIFWKEVDGIYNADPNLTDEFQLIPQLSYKESVEQAFYGAKILHPKTIKPLQNKNIPISVKSFYKPETTGTRIVDSSELRLTYPPIFIVIENQILISVSTLDFSFISEENLEYIFKLLTKHRLKVNLMQASAISFSLCITNNAFKIPELMAELKGHFKVRYNEHLTLVTIRHYNEDAIKKMTEGKTVLVQQTSRDTIQFVIR